MAENTSLIALINAYIKRNSNQEITGPVLNGVLRAIAYALSTPFIGEDGYWYAYNAETGVFEKTDTPAQGPVGPVGVTEAGASIDSSIGTPSVEVSLNGTRLDFSFHNLKGQKGDTGNPGITNAVVTVDAAIGTPSVSANIQDTTLYLAFSGLKGEQGLQGIQGVSIQSVQQVTTSIQSGGTNVIRVTLDNGQTFDFQVMNGQQGNSGYQGAAGELEVVNNLTDGGATKALSAEMGKTLKGDVDQLEAKVDDLSTGKYYGYFATSADLPDDATVDGFAYVGGGPTYTIYNCVGGVWTSSDITVNQSPIGNDEDIDQNDDGKLQFADRTYNAQQPNGMGYKILRKDATFASQVTDTNTIYEIRYPFDITGTVTIPAGCELRFNGGKLIGGTIQLNGCNITATLERIFDGCSFASTSFPANKEVFPEWFGAVGDGVTDDSVPMQSAIDVAQKDSKTIILSKVYYMSTAINIGHQCRIVGRYSSRNYSNCGFLTSAGAINIVAAPGVEIENVYFKQSATQTADTDCITITGMFSSHLIIERCSFFNYTGYGIYFGVGYSQHISIRNILCENCGGIIGGDGTTNPQGYVGLVVTEAIVEQIDLEGGVNQVSPKSVLLDLSGFREYRAKNIITEGRDSNGGTICKISNNKWNYLDGFHTEFTGRSYTVGLEIVGSPFGPIGQGEVVVNNPPYPIKVSAEYTKVHINGLLLPSSNDNISIVGEGSSVIVDDSSFYDPNYNIINPETLGRREYNGVRRMTGKHYPLDVAKDVVLFDWTPEKGDLYDFRNAYFSVVSDSKVDEESAELTQTNDIGVVFKITMKQNPTYYRSPVLKFRPNADTKSLLYNKAITLSITYRIVTSNPTPTNVRIINVLPINYSLPLVRSILNDQIYNEVATALCSVFFDDNVNTFQSYYIYASAQNYNYDFEILGVKIVAGTRGYMSMPYFPVSEDGIKYGTTTQRSQLKNIQVGQVYFDETINKPVWYNGTGWVDATGATV